MPNGEKWNEYIKQYQKNKCTRYSIILSNSKDNDIIDYFNNCNGNIKRSSHIKKIIRFYMKNNPNG